MKRPSFAAAFTLLEMLAAMAVLALLGALVGQMLSGSLRTVGLARGQMEAFRLTRALSDALEADLRRATVCTTPGRYLNLLLAEDDDAVRLGLSVPALRVRSLEAFGTVSQVLYQWDKKTKRLQRTELSSARDSDLVNSTGSSPDGADLARNERRLQTLSPAYAGESAFAWLQSPQLLGQAERTREAPLLEAVADLEIICYRDRALSKTEGRNVWQRSDRLPAALRIRALVAATPLLASSPKSPGLRSIDLSSRPTIHRR